jgi:hypothetical protein
MSEITCKRCGESKPADQFGDDKRTETGKARTCQACKKPRGGRPKGSGRGRAKSKRKAKASAPVAEHETPTLHLDAGFGLQAAIDGSTLVLKQPDSQGKVDTIILSRTEVKVLFAQFGEWAA